MSRVAAFAVWLHFTRCLLWNIGSPEPGEWMVWAGDWLKCGGSFDVAATIDADRLTFTLVDDSDREYEPDCWEWQIGRRSGDA
jgi:hypothetical protein